MPRERLSACLIVQNERKRLSDALESVRFCDEIIVVDGGSTDGTQDIALAAGARVIENPWPGFAAQRNIAIDAARTEWVFELDADERVSPALRESIEDFLAQPGTADIAVCPLRNRFLGRLLGPSAKYPAYRSRLFRRSAYRHDESRLVHEGIEPREMPAVLSGDLEHELASTPGEAVRDAWRYAKLERRHLPPPANPLAYPTGILVRPTAKFLYRAIIESGWRDGWQGLAKIALDAGSDAIVWMLLLADVARRDARRRSATEQAGRSGHFGRRADGSPKVVALAPRGRSAQAARDWLQSLAEQGMDVVLISDEPPAVGDLRHRAITSLSPLRTARALEVEMQIRTIRAVVAFGTRARLVRRLLPPGLRPSMDELQRRARDTEPTARRGYRCGG